jgi:hypothetical protein
MLASDVKVMLDETINDTELSRSALAMARLLSYFDKEIKP